MGNKNEVAAATAATAGNCRFVFGLLLFFLFYSHTHNTHIVMHILLILVICMQMLLCYCFVIVSQRERERKKRAGMKIGQFQVQPHLSSPSTNRILQPIELCHLASAVLVAATRQCWCFGNLPCSSVQHDCKPFQW